MVRGWNPTSEGKMETIVGFHPKVLWGSPILPGIKVGRCYRARGVFCTFTSGINHYMVHITSKKPNCRFSEHHLKDVEVFASFLHFRHKFFSRSYKPATSFCISNGELPFPLPISCCSCVTTAASCLHSLKLFSLEYHSEIQIFSLRFTDENWQQSWRHLPGVQNQNVPLPFGVYTKSMSHKASYIGAFLTSLTWYKYIRWYASAVLQVFRKSHHLEVGFGSLNL